ncbi:hypothetical protein HK103_003537 [Boothiomyces macroporosus]|uniref:Uncharacterized protein n=1 Tax=Boothiomyces macroporosus TaxID=261099 RepID=A0AAD5UKR9_9FUNG|nr:hypothetical protein HK103_003537 [Boothiomyces macroporosus]
MEDNNEYTVYDSASSAKNVSQQPALPNEYLYREGNAGMLGLLGFFFAVFPSSVLDAIDPTVPKQIIFMYLTLFGGLLQIYAGSKDFHHGNTFTACIFSVFGYAWVGEGIMAGNLQVLQPTTTGATPSNDYATVMGVYLTTLTLMNTIFLILSWHHPRGSLLLFITLGFVEGRLLGSTAGAFTANHKITQFGAYFGAIGALLALYSFIAEAYAEEGIVLPTGKFDEVVTKRRPYKGEKNV